MRRIITYIVGMVLLTVAVGCGDAHYDSRLAAIDSIIESSPDSALALLRAMPQGSITRGDDRAYYALLLTEARYKCYDSIASTDTIDLALDHFASNGDREKLTRSLIYKGATLEELGNPTDAMRFYKQAEETASPSDYHNLGYTNLRMAEVYRDAYVGNQMEIEKYRIALSYFEKTGNIFYKFVCLNNIGAQYRITDMDSAFKFSNLALLEAKKMCDTAEICSIYESIARAYLVSNDYNSAKLNAMTALNLGEKYNSNDIYFDLCQIYSHFKMVDSAEYYLSKASVSDAPHEIVQNNWALCKLNIAKGDYYKALQSHLVANRISDSLQRFSQRVYLIETNRLFDEDAIIRRQIAAKEQQLRLTILVGILLLLVVAISILVLRKTNQNKILKQNIQQIYSELELCKNNLAIKFDEQENLSKILQNHIDVTKRMLESLFRNENNSKQFIADFKNAFTVSKLSNNFWKDIQIYADDKNKGVISHIQTLYPNLSDDEINFITLISLGFSYIEITVCMGYSNYRYVSTKSSRIAKKMGIAENLAEYIKKLARNDA